MAVSKTVSLLSRFKGALVGAVLGDCIGAYFEGMSVVSLHDLLEFISDKIETQRKNPAPFTDDTAMARSVAYSFIEHKQLNVKDLAERFTTEFFKEPNRGYGGSVATVFSALRDENYAEPFGPASRQFDGSGSYGNGGGMRIVPAALFGYKMSDVELDNITRDITKITHSNPLAINGAILQCAAVHNLLNKDDSQISGLEFIDCLLKRMSSVEKTTERTNVDTPYCEKLKLIQHYLKQDTDPSMIEFEQKVGTGIAALEACPAAVYSFVRCCSPVHSIPERSPFERTIIHSISLGGDTDTIATMSGAMAGAYYGIEMIPSSWQQSCEGVQDALDCAQELYDLVNNEMRT